MLFATPTGSLSRSVFSTGRVLNIEAFGFRIAWAEAERAVFRFDVVGWLLFWGFGLRFRLILN